MTSAATREFLERACAACRRYDRHETLELPIDTWPNILDDLNLDDSGEACKFLMEHLSAAGEGRFTYLPLLEALQSGPPPSGATRGGDLGSPPPGACGGSSCLDFDGDSTQRLPPGDERMPPPNLSDAGKLFASDGQVNQGGSCFRGAGGRSDDGRPNLSGPPGGFDDRYRRGATGGSGGGGYGGSDGGDPSCGGEGPSGVARAGYPHEGGSDNASPPIPPMSGVRAPYADHEPPREQAPRGYAVRAPFADHHTEQRQQQLQQQQQQIGGVGAARQPSACGAERDLASSTDRPLVGRDDSDCLDQTSSVVEEVNEVFWARRAATIQELYRMWDCNQLSNDAFAARLQDVLGEAVDVTSVDSEFVRLANKHRSARNMKFAALMSALRRDAQGTHARRFGRPMSHTGLSSYAGSYAPSNYEPSDAGTEAAAHAAGRPTGVAAVQPSLRAGRRHYYAEGHMSGAALAFAEQQARPLPTRLEGVDERGPVPPFATGGVGHGPPSPLGGVGGGGSVAGDMHGSPPAHGGGQRGGVRSVGSRSDVGCAAASDLASVAGSQRAEFTQRNRTGHGNILTWGDDSRSVTPGKERQGKQITVDPAQGIPRSRVSSGVIPGGRSGY
mmetsp:Transcript_26930/g.78113  ORF Transcript_26930/g.78113 Transcript_26930/m.78113 type:complete len:615 (+) Transcript_26930:81-1925(+)